MPIVRRYANGMDERLRPFERIRRPREYRRVFQRGRAFRTPNLRIHFVPSPDRWSRLGLVVRKRLGKAVRRNRVKRLLRVVFRRSKHRLRVAYDVVLVPENEPRDYRDYLEAFERFAAHVSSHAWTKPTRRPHRGGRRGRGGDAKGQNAKRGAARRGQRPRGDGGGGDGPPKR